MAKTTLTGHPLHAILSDWPVGNLTFSFMMDVMRLVTRKKSYDDAAYYSMASGCIGAGAAAAAGAADYFEIPSGTEAKRAGNAHALLNIGLIGLYTVNLMMRGRQRANGGKSGITPFLMSAAGSAGLTVSAWYGGHMIYEHGMRVKGKSPVEGAPDLKLPVDDRVARAFSRMGEKVTAAGPEFRGVSDGSRQQELPSRSESQQR